VVSLSIETLDELSQRYPKTLRQNLHGRQADILFATLHVGNVAAVYAKFFGSANLRPATSFPQFSESRSESDTDSSRHTAILLVVFGR
jgi:hypothetical protein